jgi:bilirubin oxidase
MERREFLELGAAFSLLGLVRCGGNDITGPGEDVARLTTGLELAPPPKITSSNGLLQVSLTAAPVRVELMPGVQTEVWAFNQSFPGPTLEAREGDRVRVQFTNQLAQPSNVHWHGLPVDPDNDGSPFNALAPGASAMYDFTLPPGSAGTYWYHPHPHHVTHEQVFRGLAGMFIVRPPSDPIPAAIEEKLIFLTDVRLDASGIIPPNTDTDEIVGREGNHLLVNGRERPKITIRAGQSQRWRIANATNSRFLKLALDGHTLMLVGTDGGLIGAPVPMNEILLSPGERIEVVVTATGAPGSTATLAALPYDRLRPNVPGPSDRVDILTLEYTRDSASSGPALPAVLRPINALGAPAGALKQVIFQRILVDGALEWTVNGRVWSETRVDLTGNVSVVEEWEVANRSAPDHPFHLHGGQFQVISRTRNGVTTPEPFLAWRDTFNMVTQEVVRFRMAQPFRGKRVFHCHILEHEDHGMMGTLDVV